MHHTTHMAICSAPVIIISTCVLCLFWFNKHASYFLPLFFHFSLPLDFFWIFNHSHTIHNPLTQLCPPSSTCPFSHIFSQFSLTICTISHIGDPDHTRKIELIRYLMSGYVNGKVLDTLSEHANALASSAVASLEDEANQLSHFPFLPVPNDPVLIVPRHHGWYTVVAK